MIELIHSKIGCYHRDVDVGVDILTVIDVKVTFLPIPTVVLDLVEFVVQVGGFEIINSDQMAP